MHHPIHTTLLCSAERAALDRKARLRRSHLNFIIYVLTMLMVSIGLGALISLADLPRTIGIIAFILWSIWLTRLLFHKQTE